MSKADDLIAARRKAQELMSRTKQKEAERLSAQEKERRAQDAKIARLRELRLAKEATEKAAMQVKQARPPSRKPR